MVTAAETSTGTTAPARDGQALERLGPADALVGGELQVDGGRIRVGVVDEQPEGGVAGGGAGREAPLRAGPALAAGPTSRPSGPATSWSTTTVPESVSTRTAAQSASSTSATRMRTVERGATTRSWTARLAGVAHHLDGAGGPAVTGVGHHHDPIGDGAVAGALAGAEPHRAQGVGRRRHRQQGGGVRRGRGDAVVGAAPAEHGPAHEQGQDQHQGRSAPAHRSGLVGLGCGHGSDLRRRRRAGAVAARRPPRRPARPGRPRRPPRVTTGSGAGPAGPRPRPRAGGPGAGPGRWPGAGPGRPAPTAGAGGG